MLRGILERGIVRYADVLGELRYLDDTNHPIIKEVNEEEKKVYYNRGRDRKGKPLKTVDVSFRAIENRISKIKNPKKN